jgi:serine protease Do
MNISKEQRNLKRCLREVNTMNDENQSTVFSENSDQPVQGTPIYTNQSNYTTSYSQGAYYGSTPPSQPEPPVKTKKVRKPIGTGGIIAICLVCAILAGLFGSCLTYAVVRNGNSNPVTELVDEIVPTPVPVITTTAAAGGAVNDTAAYIYELACQQVVGINTEISYNIFGQYSSASVSGSGVIITEDGYILTNYHVVEDAEEGGYPVTVMMYDETSYDAEIVGYDEDSDLALLKIDAQGLNAAQLGDSDDMTVGQIVYAVGNPLGELNYTMTSGIISATDRTITTDENVAVNMFQIDAAVNSGNSGGPVYNSEGQVIGIVTAKYSSTGVEGLGFAIPISDAAHIVNQILEYGYVTDKASLGITAVSVTSSIARYYNMVEGAYVNEVNEGSAAEAAGLQVGDIITYLDDQEVAGASELTSLVKQYHAGDEATLTVWRDGETETLTVVFDEKLPEEEEDDTQEETTNEPQWSGQGGYYSGDMEDFFRQFFGFGY